MSHFIDNLDQVTKAAARSIGFRSGKVDTAKPRMQLVASITSGSSTKVEGVDAVVLRVSGTNEAAEELKGLCKASDVPCGGWLDDEAVKDVKALEDAGIDFIIFPANAPVAVFGDKPNAIGRVIEVDSSLNIGLLRAISDLPVNAVLLSVSPDSGQSVTWNHLMLYKHFSSAVDRHLLVNVPSAVTADEIKALWDARVNGVIIEAGSQQQMSDISALRKAIDGITFPARQKQIITRLNIPSAGGAEVEGEEEEEEEEDE